MKLKLEDKIKIITMYETGHSVPLICKKIKVCESALEAPYQTFDGKELYPSKEEKAARLGYGLVANHPFVDGNKRIGLYVMISF